MYVDIYIEYIIPTQMMKVCIHLCALQTTIAQLMHAGDTKKLLRVTQEPGSNF